MYLQYHYALLLV